MGERIVLEYRRLPDDVAIYENELVLDTEDVIVSRFIFSDISNDFLVDGRRVVENGYTGLYFEFVNDWHDIIKVYDWDERFIGYYCDINTPIVRFPGGFRGTDLCLDLWVFPDMRHFVLDEAEFERAIDCGWLDKERERMARKTLARLIDEVESGEFPPAVVRDTGLEKGEK